MLEIGRSLWLLDELLSSVLLMTFWLFTGEVFLSPSSFLLCSSNEWKKFSPLLKGDDGVVIDGI